MSFVLKKLELGCSLRCKNYYFEFGQIIYTDLFGHGYQQGFEQKLPNFFNHVYHEFAICFNAQALL
jgi:hypothetical protein